jgi:hypothetical protein
MGRRGVIVLSSDCAAKAFVDELLEDTPTDERDALLVTDARTCIAVLACSLRRRLLIVDGTPQPLSAGALVEAVRLIDRELPILLVRHDWHGQAITHDGIRIVPGPLISDATVAAISVFVSASVR